jgi:opacity protein-like surface antigen
MSMKKSVAPVTVVLMLAALAAVMLSSAQKAAAIPAFSREHGLKCGECHEPFPLLNEFGMEFKQRGFRLPEENGKYPWELKSLPVSMIGTMHFLNAHENDPVTKARLSTTSKAEIEFIEFMAAGTAAPKIGFLADFVQPMAEGGAFGNEQIWLQFSDLLPSSMLNVRAGRMLNEQYYLSQKRRLAFQRYLAPVTFNVTGAELNGFWSGVRYAAGVVNDEREEGVNVPTVSFDKKLQGFYTWGTYTLWDHIVGIRYINTKANSDLPSPIIDGRTRQQLDATLNLRFARGQVLLGYYHNWDIGGIAKQDRRNYLVEGILEVLPEKLFLEARYEMQDTGVVFGSPNNPVKANGTLVTAHASYHVTENVLVGVEFTKVSGEGLDVQGIGDLNGRAASSQERYLAGIDFAY